MTEYTFRKDEKGLKSFSELMSDYDMFTIFEAYLKPFYEFAKGIYKEYKGGNKNA